MEKSVIRALCFLPVLLLSLGSCASAPPDNREAEAVAAANSALGAMNGSSLAGPPAGAVPGAAGVDTSRIRPAWVDSPETVYNRNRYVAAVGSGAARDLAEKNAFTALSSIYRLSLQADQTITNSYQEMVKNGRTSDWYEGVSLEESIRTSTAMDLVGAAIRDVWSDGSLFYAVAVMENAQTARLYTQMIQDNQRIIDTLTDIPSASRNNMDSLARFQFAITLAEANKVFANVLSVIGAPLPPGMRQSEDYRLEIAGILRAMPVSVTVEGDRENRIRSAFAAALT
ncbi:MAG: LPP20 family lipoprotein, partial [Treponema sp.]|nr:LPP20 family lipoprotein [Treponema sp.]